MSKKYTRREMLNLTGQAVAAGAVGTQAGFATEEKSPGQRTSAKSKFAAVTGEADGAAVGEKILASGGNAIDAAVAAALTACVTSPSKCGVGGYGGHLIIARADTGKITAIDFNSAAPAAARPDMYPLDEKGSVIGQVNFHGWRAVGVPGTMAGLQLALDRYGTRSFRELVAPAIEFAEEGCHLTEAGAANTARLFKINPLKPGEKFRNPKLAALLKTLARENSMEPFYRGDIARRIATAIGRNGGLVTFDDLAAYRAREVEPLRLKWNELEVFTAPLTAGGMTILEMLSIVRATNWESLPTAPERAHVRLEAQRLAWKNRLELLGDPESVRVPVERLLSEEHAHEAAAKIQGAVKEKKPLPLYVQDHSDEGTVNISAVDERGNMAAITLTHGHGWGAHVVVEEFGLVLGHGMSRFNPRPGHPNSVAPGKRPLHNMCPSIVQRAGKAVLAVGGAGGVMIPNSIFNVLLLYLTGASMEQALAAPRLQNTGTLDVSVEKNWPEADIAYLKSIGFKVQTGLSAFVSAVSFDPGTGERHAQSR